MSKFTFEKLKGGGKASGSPPVALGSFRFHKSTEDLEKVEEEENVQGGAAAELKERVDSAVIGPHLVDHDQKTEQLDGGNEGSLPQLGGGSESSRQQLGGGSEASWQQQGGSKDVSPIKEKLLCTFAKLAPDTSAGLSQWQPPQLSEGPVDLSDQPEQQGEAGSASWLTQVRGKLAKTVDTSLEKYAELKAERLRHARLQEMQGNTSHPGDTGDPVELRLPHSQSEMVLRLPDSAPSMPPPQQLEPRPQSQIFDMDISDWGEEQQISSSNNLLRAEIESASQDLPPTTSTDTPSLSSSVESKVLDTPTKTRKRFGIPFLERKNSNAAGSPTKSEATDTPKRSIRSLMRSYVSKTPVVEKSSTPPTSSSLHLPQEDPFSGTDLFDAQHQSETKKDQEEEEIEEGEEAEGLLFHEESFGQEDTPSLQRPRSIFDQQRSVGGDSGGGGVGHGHDLGFPPATASSSSSSSLPSAPPTSSTSAPLSGGSVHALPSPEFVHPVLFCLLVVVNMTSLLPGWLAGFVTGLILCGLVTVRILLKLYPPIVYPRSSEPNISSPITIHEPPVLVQAWMNLLPHPFHPYDVDTYEVKNTISVRVTIEHHMLKIEYPDKNIPKRLNADEIIPPDLKFHFHTDHIDLTRAKISLLPEGIAGKRMFSKKYPIEIRPNCQKPPEFPLSPSSGSGSSPVKARPAGTPSKQLKSAVGSVSATPGKVTAASKELVDSSGTARATVSNVDSRTGNEPKEDEEPSLYASQIDSEDEEDTQADLDQLERDDFSFEMLEGERKVFYLFARADREKEDLYKALNDGHFFLADTQLDTSRRAVSSHLGKIRRETARERKAKFSDYMARILDPSNRLRFSPLLPRAPGLAEAEVEGGGVGGEEGIGAGGGGHVPESGEGCINFFNIFLHRVFYDIHKSEEIKSLLKSRIYNKLLKIKITQWFKQIDVTEIYMGTNLPKVIWVSRPTQNDRGLWVELGIEYGGIASATIETCGFNLGEEQVDGAVHLKDLLNENLEALPLRPSSPSGERKISSRIEAATNSEEEDSAESDSEESGEAPGVLPVPGSSSVEAVATPRARWWEVVGNSEIVKSGITRLSNSEWFKAKTSKKMTLQLEITHLKGVIVLNIPPPPSDRLWYGFKDRPELGLRILPYYGDIKLGEDNSLFSSAVNKGIEVLVNRLKEEIHKFILLPNMDDLPIRIMTSLPANNLTVRK